MSQRAIGDHALLSDCRSAALVTSEGSVDWLCLPRFDSPAIFARLLDEDAGHWFIGPDCPAEVTRRYIGQTLVLETTFHTRSGTLILLDALALGKRERVHTLGASSPGLLLRQVTCVAGSVPVTMVYAPRPEFGLVQPLMQLVRGGLIARGGATVLTLSSPVELRVNGSTAAATFALRAGQSLGLALQAGWAWAQDPPCRSTRQVRRRIKDTIAGWRSWSRAHATYQGPWREQVQHSGRVLRAMTYAPTGAIVAAATTSLPETVGGERNWDYRFTWVRDASFTLQALSTAACEKEETAFFTFLARASATRLDRDADLQIMYGIGGERDLSERLLPHLTGWRGSAPVRVGNDAWRQYQLDVYGELLDAAYQTYCDIGPFDPLVRTMLATVAETAARRWREPDQSLWEVRSSSRHFTHSKLMCWVGLDRAIALAPLLGAEHRVADWSRTREEIRTAILKQAWNEQAGSFTQTFGGTDLDAALLMIPLVGFLSADDPRVRSTVHAVATQLTGARGLVHRYRTTDGLPGQEGTFLLCTFWLAHALALSGDDAAARRTFEIAASHANDVGLLAEEVDSATGEPLGNFPQALSHIGLINAAHAIGGIR
ncbi:glycoside hydrolase family 15 protein [Streptosporangium sp. NPDC087985]|uniref:glycoside hydrolase family 15 protein n=1 Tax=Streptosporangium sp. NPDC087985 TaxID=3366196 RepID=UPI00382526D4